ncbi:hypothetical protein [Rhizobium sp. MHM7A]|uniref:hypothetical protein n=1 Tax=Rhizobium sp. MHM7A TaxID=2583233 RepID=UPI0011061DCC|nr:hypothetical protein [Rhizobium sp. MHM7A]TLX16538.1 hypothetical protein FFR93_04160 [Rhizobium sp. MHM7A]
MLFKLPYIVQGHFQRGRRTEHEEGYITYLIDVDIPELSGEAAPAVAEVKQFGATIPVRRYGDQFYVPLIDYSGGKQEVLGLDHLKRANWPDYAGALVQMLRPVLNDEGAVDMTTHYGYWAYQNMFTTLKGSDGGGHAAYVPEAGMRWSTVTEEERYTMQRAAVHAYQSCRIIDGIPYRPCAEPRYVARFRFSYVQIDIRFDEIAHGKALGLKKEEEYEPPMELASFRLDRHDDLVDYVDSRVAKNFERSVIGDLEVILNDMGAFQYDDEANDLIRSASWIIEEDYQYLLTASDKATLAWAELKRDIGQLRRSGEADLGDDLTQALRDYHPFAMSEDSKTAIVDATNRFDMRPVGMTRKF